MVDEVRGEAEKRWEIIDLQAPNLMSNMLPLLDRGLPDQISDFSIVRVPS